MSGTTNNFYLSDQESGGELQLLLSKIVWQNALMIDIMATLTRRAVGDEAFFSTDAGKQLILLKNAKPQEGEPRE
jgi:hypothetical protein